MSREYHYLSQRWNLITSCQKLVLLVNVCYGEVCYRRGGYFNKEEYSISCIHGCCGTAYDRYCCSELPVGLIIAIVLGCLLIVIVFVTILCYYKRRKKPSETFGSTNNTGPETAPTSSATAGNDQQQIQCPSYTVNADNQGTLYIIGLHGDFNDRPPAYEDVIKGK